MASVTAFFLCQSLPGRASSVLYPTTFGTSLYECPSLWRTPKLTLAIILPTVIAVHYSPPDERTEINKARLRFPTSKLCATNPRYPNCDWSRSAQVNSLRLVELSGVGNRDSRSVRPGRPPGEIPDEMHFGTGKGIPEQLSTAREKARQERIEVNRNLPCDTCHEQGQLAMVVNE